MTQASGPAAAADPSASKAAATPAPAAKSPPSDAAAPSEPSLLAGEELETEEKPLASHDTTIAHSDVEDPNSKVPAWLPKNFVKDGKPDYEALAKSQHDLREMVSKGLHKAPKDGKYGLEAFGEHAKDDDPAIKMFTGWAAKHGLPQGAFDEFAQQFIELGKSLAPETVDPATYIASEEKKLGQNGKALIKGAAEWGRSLISKGVLSRDDWDEYKAMAGSAGGVRILLKMREIIEGPLPINNDAQVDGLPSKQELEAMVGDPKYTTDPAYRGKVEKLYQRMYPQ